MEKTTEKQNQLMSEIFSKGYRKASDAFGSITGQKVTIDEVAIDFFTAQPELIKKLSDLNDYTIIRTRLMGDVKGESYLLLSPSERVEIAKLSLHSFGGNVDIEDEEVYKEIDNILSASVITELSNTLGVSMFGGVPEIISQEEWLEVIKPDSDKQVQLTLVNARFRFEHSSGMKPIFIWKISNSAFKK